MGWVWTERRLQARIQGTEPGAFCSGKVRGTQETTLRRFPRGPRADIIERVSGVGRAQINRGDFGPDARGILAGHQGVAQSLFGLASVGHGGRDRHQEAPLTISSHQPILRAILAMAKSSLAPSSPEICPDAASAVASALREAKRERARARRSSFARTTAALVAFAMSPRGAHMDDRALAQGRVSRARIRVARASLARARALALSLSTRSAVAKMSASNAVKP